MKSIYKKINISQEDFVLFLQKEYDSGKSQSQIAKDLNIHITTIEQYWKKFNLKARSLSDAAWLSSKSCNFNKNEKEIFDGIMLADGHLEPGPRTARLTYGCKYIETIKRIKNDLINLKFNNFWQNPKDKCWFSKTLFYKELHLERQRWYPNNIKIVPANIVLTPLVCYWWYIGDGSNLKYGIQLSTDGFAINDVMCLVNKLNSLGFECTIQKSNNRIRINSKSKKVFLDYISKNIEVQKEYLYKWN